MSNRRRIYYNQAVYHICIRGNNRQNILKEAEDKIVFFESLSKFKERFGFKVYAIVVMDNHAHLIIEATGIITISKIMHAIILSYSVKFRKKYHYSGYVWQGRFKSNVIEGEGYILSCIEYSHLNPVRANMVTEPQDYPWSSYYLYHGQGDTLKHYIALDKFKG